MLLSPVVLPLLHGQSGIFDELLLFGAPLIVVIIILAAASRRARQNVQPRDRPARDRTNNPPPPSA